MQHVFKKHSVHAAWAILSVWVFYTVIHTGVALLQLNLHHYHTEYELQHKKQKPLVCLTILPESKDFIRVNKKEFIWQGEWYDIKEITEQNGTLYIIAYPDKKEKKFQERLAKALEQHQEQSQKGKNHVKFELKESYVSAVKFLFIPLCRTFFILWYLILDTQSVHLSLPKPPPEFTT